MNLQRFSVIIVARNWQ